LRTGKFKLSLNVIAEFANGIKFGMDYEQNESNCTVTLEDREILFRVARWTSEQKYFRIQKIRQLAGTEENYRILIRELDRVKAQVQRARSLEADATLTLVDWLTTLEQFDWCCAYCLTRPFEVMSHIIPLPRGGTTPDNCVPACYSCCTGKRKSRMRHYVEACEGR
jgi:5-methylcytosine-specific restriction endonuclease McrA